MLSLAAYLHGYPGLTAAEDLPSVKEPENVSEYVSEALVHYVTHDSHSWRTPAHDSQTSNMELEFIWR